MPSYEFPRPTVACDTAVLREAGDSLEVLLIRRGQDPYVGTWALPGGFVSEGETLEDAARRELLEETGLSPSGPLLLVGAYGDPGRDPRGWAVTVTYAVLPSDADAGHAVAGDDAAEAAWFPIESLPPLAFDHREIMDDVLAAVAGEAGGPWLRPPRNA